MRISRYGLPTTHEDVSLPAVDREAQPKPARSRDREAAEDAIARAEAAIEIHDYERATAALGGLRSGLAARELHDLELRALLADSWAHMMLGEIELAQSLLERARDVAAADAFSDTDRAEVLYRLGCCKTKLSANTEAVQLYTVALELCERSGRLCDRLRAEILEWRSRSYRNLRDFEAAHADAERALQLAHALDDAEARAHVYLQASLVAERTGQWLVAKFYAEQARDLYAEAGDEASVGRILNNLGGLSFLLGRHDEALAYLKEAFRRALETGNEVDAAYAASSLAQVNLRTGNPSVAEEQALHALRLLAERVEFMEEVGNAQLVLGRALLELGRLAEAEEVFARAENTFDRFGSVSHRAAAWVARGDLARRRNDAERAADLYRRAAEALQDFHF